MELKPGMHRYTVAYLKSGQERAYADTVNRYRIYFEWVPYNKPYIWEPSDETDEVYVHKLAKFFGGWTEKGEGDWASTRLVYLKKVEDEPGCWEWETRATFTD